MADWYNPTGGHGTRMPAPLRTTNTTSLTIPPLTQMLQRLERGAKGAIRITFRSLDAVFIAFSINAHADSSTYKYGLFYAGVNTRERICGNQSCVSTNIYGLQGTLTRFSWTPRGSNQMQTIQPLYSGTEQVRAGIVTLLAGPGPAPDYRGTSSVIGVAFFTSTFS